MERNSSERRERQKEWREIAQKGGRDKKKVKKNSERDIE